MSPRKLKSAAARATNYWAFSFGQRGCTVHARELPERGYTIAFRWTDPTKTGRDKRQRLYTSTTVRGANGRTDNNLVRKVELEVKAMSVRLAQGLPAIESPEEGRDEELHANDPEQLTIARGFEIALHPTTGKFDDPTARHVQQLRSFRDVLLQPRMLGPRFRWVDIKRENVRGLYRQLAADHMSDSDISGPRHAEMVLDTLFATAAWLITEERLPNGACQPWKHWRKDVRGAFAKSPKRNQTKVVRYDPVEITKMFGVVGDPRARLFNSLLPHLTLEATEAAVASLQRTSVRLHETSAGTVAVIQLRWMRNHRDGTTSDATHRVTLDGVSVQPLLAALHDGYLRDLESAYRSGALSDYPLFPSDMKDGRAPLGANTSLSLEAPSVLTIDPRIDLAVNLGGELRIGQVIACMRSALHLEAIEHAPFGMLLIQGTEQKPSENLVLSQYERDAVDHALATYLCEFEATYDAKRLSTDYPLFPSGTLRQGIARAASTRRQSYTTATEKTRNGKQLTRDAALKMYREIERAAGVELIAGRAWYGLRRGTTDVAPSLTADRRTLNRLGGWSPGSDMREAIYQDGESVKIGAWAADVRDQLRGRGNTPDPVATGEEAEHANDTADELLAALPEEVLRAMRQKLLSRRPKAHETGK